MPQSENEANKSILCSVRSCQNHCSGEDFCSLDYIKIGAHESNPTICQYVDCESFLAKAD
ncbi:MAG: DUF1540 domain-containing protein [Clostridia bacterium]|nr:DUF1540 domain-containing protein [Clostridia bacterium]